VHCGFCLQSCPTYVVTGDEGDSPRGRIVLMRRLDRGELPPDDPSLRHHLDRCLGCRACEPVCPSGVAYGPALEAARAAIGERRTLPVVVRLILHTITSPPLRRLLFGLARAARPFAGALAGWSRAGFAAGMLAGSRDRGIGRGPREPFRSLDPPSPGSADRPVAVFLGCIQRDLFGHVNAAAARTLRVNGYTLREVSRQGCCGALHAHAGRLDAARALARENVHAFAECPDALVAATAAGCGAMLREYGTLLADDPLAEEARRFSARVRDVTEVLAAQGPVPGAPVPLTVAYDAPCHLVHAQRVTGAPLAVLGAVPELAVVPHEDADTCCGSAGLYSLVQRGLAREILERKLDALAAANPDVVATGNPGCAMQISAGLRASGRPIPVVHPVELLDASYARAGRYAEDAVDSRGP
jgi:glycolate oxidase iron-sulfur subunit